MENENDNNALETLIFIVLNLAFFAILMFFIYRAGTGELFLGEFSAKQIALLVDNAKPGTIISIDFSDAYNLAKKNSVNLQDIVSMKNNLVFVKLSNGYTYSFKYFSDVDVRPEIQVKDDKTYLNLYVIDKQEVK